MSVKRAEVAERRKECITLFHSGLFQIKDLAQHMGLSECAISKYIQHHYDQKKYNRVHGRL